MKSILILFFLGVSLSAFSQSDFDNRLLAKYSETQIIELQQKNPNIIGYLEYYLNYGFSIIPESDLNGNTTTGSIQLKSLQPSKINTLDLGVPLPLNTDAYYNIDGKTEVFVLHGRKKMMSEFQNNLKESRVK